jgi:hypothetical protein
MTGGMNSDRDNRALLAKSIPELAEISLPKGLEMFQPTHFQGILLNSYDPNRPEVKWSIMSGITRGSLRLYDMEALLTGRIEPDSSITEYLGYGKEEFALIGVKESLANTLKDPKRSCVYDLVRIQPYEPQRAKLEESLEKFAKTSTQKTLTFIYLTTHGYEDGSFKVDTSSMKYQDLLDRCDNIKGKKVIVAMGCYSGTLINEIGTRETSGDYIAITSAPNDARGVNWYEDHLDNALWNIIQEGKPISQLTAPIPNESVKMDGADPWPTVVGAYDVVMWPHKAD